MMIALDDVWPALGSTRIVPAAIAGRIIEGAPLDEVVAGHFKAGDALLYTGSMLHGGGANETVDQRMGTAPECRGGLVDPEEAITQNIRLIWCEDAQMG